MLLSVIIFSIAVLVALYFQVKWANDFVNLYRHTAPAPDSTDFPHVGVVMSLRGADPYLEACLRGLMSLDYPSHEVRIVVDNEADPAYSIVQRVREELDAANVSVEILQLSQATSSLKNLALIQAITGCSNKCEAYAWLDSDTVPYSGWLRDLVAPLDDEEVGAACGIRWYAPPTQSLANYVRHIWNAAAVLQMSAFQIGWGGAFAIRRAVMEEANLLQQWGRSMTEDTLASNAVLERGQRIAFVASATMPNPESASLSWCLSFITRQLQLLRYYHRAWRSVLWFGLFSGFVIVADIVCMIMAFQQGDYMAGSLAMITLVSFGYGTGWLLRRSEKQVIAQLGDRSIGGISTFWRLIIAAPITQLIHTFALVQAYTQSGVTWRGINYKIRSGTDLTRTNYVPYESKPDQEHHSI